MTRLSQTDRLQQLIDAATKVFMRLGYRRAQIADIAREMGVAPGTVYLYVESKEALFDLALRHVMGEESLPTHLPVPSPPPGAILEHVRRQFFKTGHLPTLAEALAGKPATDVRAEFEAVVRELYALINRHWRAIRLLERSASDWPELAELYYHQARRGFIQQLTDYLDLRIGQKCLRPMPDSAAAARLMMETAAWFAYHRYHDKDSAVITDEAARETVVTVLVNAFTPHPG